MTVGGRSVGSDARYDVVNPATGAAFAEAPACSPEQLDAAFDAAQGAFGAWSADDDARRSAIEQVARVYEEAVDLAPLIVAEQGKPLEDAKLEFGMAAAWFRYYATVDVPTEQVLQDDDDRRAVLRRRPLGVVSAIAPWNFPVAQLALKLGPALRAGNTVVLKPSPFTPLTALRLGERLQEVLPPGVLNTVSGGDGLGRAMTTHPSAAKITFTGSIEGGKAVAAAAAADLKRVTLELGGNDPAVVLDDVDVAVVAPSLFWLSMYNNGQTCACIKRIYVPATRHDELVDALAAIAESIVIGDGMAPTTMVGPLSTEPQYRRVRGLLADAVDAGARIAAGGVTWGDDGYFIRPTVLTDVTDGDRVVDEEQFGPLIPVIKYTDETDAFARAGNSRYGLGSSVWGSDLDRARAAAIRLNTGMIWINMHADFGPNHPFAGARWSGLGAEGGIDGLHAHMQIHVTQEKKLNP